MTARRHEATAEGLHLAGQEKGAKVGTSRYIGTKVTQMGEVRNAKLLLSMESLLCSQRKVS